MTIILLLYGLLLIVSLDSVIGAPFIIQHGNKNVHLKLGNTPQRLHIGSILALLRHGEQLTMNPENETNVHATTNWVFPLNQPGDGHEVEPYIPRRFIRMQKGNLEKAKVAYNTTLSWRASHEVDTILARPHPAYDVLKQVLPHFFPGRDTAGNIIFCQQPGLLRMELLELNNLTQQDLLMHYVFILEYCWNVLEPRPDQTMTSILDGRGLSLRTVKKLFSFLTEFVSMMSQHYPQRSYKTLIINAPAWAGTIYKLISPILRESTRSKISILNGGTRQEEVLKDILGKVPTEISTAGCHNGADSAFEQEIRAFVMTRLVDTQLEMNIVKEPTPVVETSKAIGT